MHVPIVCGSVAAAPGDGWLFFRLLLCVRSIGIVFKGGSASAVLGLWLVHQGLVLLVVGELAFFESTARGGREEGRGERSPT